MGKETKRLIHTVGVEAGLAGASYGAKKTTELIHSRPLTTYPGTNVLRPQPLKWGAVRSLARTGKLLHFGIKGVPLVGQLVDLFTSSDTIMSHEEEKRYLRGLPPVKQPSLVGQLVDLLNPSHTIMSGDEEKQLLRKATRKQQAVSGPDANLQALPGIVTRSRPGTPRPMKFQPEIITHSPAFRKYGFPMPKGQADPFPRELRDVLPHLRQDFLRDYYAANPLAAQKARNEARRIVDWTHQELRQPFSVPTGRRDPFPHDRLRVPIDQRQNWLRDYYAANPMAAARARSEARTMIDWAHKKLR